MEEIKSITIESSNYPKELKKIKNPPKILYYKGKIIAEELCFAVVGARIYSTYGKQTALEIVGELAESNLTIISGLAPGIDTFSHLATIERKKRTIAVLGTGLDNKSIYPQSNLKLAQRILNNNGALISEYPPKTHGSKFSFPNRNRIISGLSLGVLVIEAKQKSGSLITANWAKKQGKKLFAVPGSIYSQNSKGCHSLIKQGAKLIESANNILKELNLPQKSINFSFVSGENKEENLILDILRKESLHIDKIIEKTKLSAASVASCFANLEIKNKVKNLGGNIYTISR